jgi:predicted dithiol-disulfide oxidoreductase (DUF899 family)
LTSLSVEPDIRFPGESGEYRRERNRLLEAEIELRRAIERVASQRRAMPPGGPVPDDYRFEEVSDSGSEVRFSELFEAGRDTLVVYSFMFPRFRAFAGERGWRHLRLLSSRNNTYNRDYHAETPEGEQVPILNVFVRDGDQLRHSWATELMFAPRDEGEDPRQVDSIWPIWSVLDVTPEGRGTESDFPKLS